MRRDVPWDVAWDVPWDVPWDVAWDVAWDVPWDVPWEFTWDVLRDVPWEFPWDVPGFLRHGFDDAAGKGSKMFKEVQHVLVTPVQMVRTGSNISGFCTERARAPKGSKRFSETVQVQVQATPRSPMRLESNAMTASLFGT